jgi:tRNA threonylcarbamoyladenosine biosynthesis protein TsaB
MLLLITDTSGRNGIVALASADVSDEVQLIESVPLAGGTFSAQLVPQISALLSNHGFGKSDIGAFVVISGPGSFTGLRVGLAAIKGLAEILCKPIVSVSLLEVIALASGKEGNVLAALDAGRGDVYAGQYQIAGESAHVHKEQLLAKDEFLSSANGYVVSTTVPVLGEMARLAGVTVVVIEPPTAEMIARVGFRKLRAHATVTPEELEANYIRRTDAEIFAKPASTS